MVRANRKTAAGHPFQTPVLKSGSRDANTANLQFDFLKSLYGGGIAYPSVLVATRGLKTYTDA